MKRISILLMTLMVVFGMSISAYAMLIDMGDETIYDTDLQLTWLKDANYAMTLGYDADGFMTWSNAMTWADTLSFAGFENWRLPSALNQDATGPCAYYNCTGSEMGHLYYTELGNPAGGPLTNVGDFTNLQPYYYWSGTEYAPTDLAWDFRFSDGDQRAYGKYELFSALAVRPGERSTSVPEPATLLLLGFGLAGIAVWRKRLG